MLSLGDDNAARPPQLSSRTGLHRRIQSDLGQESPNPCEATARHAEVAYPGHDKSS
jgi:hypothetical protein